MTLYNHNESNSFLLAELPPPRPDDVTHLYFDCSVLFALICVGLTIDVDDEQICEIAATPTCQGRPALETL
jgi:hypothetical protein